MNRIIGTSEIYEYAEKYNMAVGKDIPLTMGWCFDMVDKAYEQGRADAIDIDMNKPMHFTDEQKAWIKKYICINAEIQRAEAIDEVKELVAQCASISDADWDWFVSEVEQLKEQK